MFRLRSCILIAATFAGLGGTGIADDKVANEQFFQAKVQPILAAKCLSCHGQKVQKSGYRLDVREIALAGGDFGEPPIVSRDSAKSTLLSYVSDESSDVVMPPKGSNVARLTSEEVEVLRVWIDHGAPWPDSDR